MYRLFGEISRLRHIYVLLRRITQDENNFLMDGDAPNFFRDLYLDRLFQKKKEFNEMDGNDYWNYDEQFFDFPEELKFHMQNFVKAFLEFNEKSLKVQTMNNFWMMLEQSEEWEVLKQSSTHLYPYFQEYYEDLMDVVLGRISQPEKFELGNETKIYLIKRGFCYRSLGSH